MYNQSTPNGHVSQPSSNGTARQITGGYLDNLGTALAMLCSGFSPLLPKEDGSKAVDGAWKRYQTQPATEATIRSWYRRGRTGNGVATGYGGLECLEFDDLTTYQAFKDAAGHFGLADLVETIEKGYCEETPGGGIHWFYQCDKLDGNTKLAERPVPGEPHKRDVLIETRGIGGFVVTAPSHGKVHPSGNPYRLLRGDWRSITTITADEREALWSLARSFDEMPVSEPPTPSRNGSTHDQKPGDAFSAENSWEDILEPLGWVKAFSRGDVIFWTRPGKNEGVSATTGHCKGLYVFSTSTSFEPQRSYSKFGAYARLHHQGDHSAAARELGRQGYGQPPRSCGQRNGNGKPVADPPGAPPAAPGAEPNIDAELAQLHATDMGNAERLVARWGKRIRYCYSWKKWLVYDGKRWVVDAEPAIAAMAKKTALRIYKEVATIANDAERTALAKWAIQCERRAFQANMIELAKSEPGIPIKPEVFDRDPWLLNVQNGTIDLRTGDLRPHRREDLITRIIPIEFDPAALCPLWDSVLTKVFGGKADLVTFWDRLCGLSLTGVTQEQILPILWGSGSNGKSTVVKTLVNLLGPDFAMISPPGLLLKKHHEAHPTDRASLYKMRLVVEMETAEGIRLDESLVKHLTGGDPITCRRMHEDYWSFDPTHKLMLCTNHKPEIRGQDHAIWRRQRLVPFTVTIPDSEAITDLPERLRAEYPGILARCVRGCLNWQRNGLRPPDEVTEATTEYRNEQDTLGGFLMDECIQKTQLRAKSKQLYDRYRRWAEGSGENALSQKRFGQAMTDRGFKRFTNNGTWYSGLGLRSDEADGERSIFLHMS
jgi:P4 family phage/plasmid primase-like protien